MAKKGTWDASEAQLQQGASEGFRQQFTQHRSSRIINVVHDTAYYSYQ